MYASLMYLAWGATLKSISLYTVALTLVATVALFFAAKAEERENIMRFGNEYVGYMRRTRRFIPFLF
jgi:protein-S-isoprenylcysteine O-methyltransferase Ste14